MALPDRFWAKVEVSPSGCWEWQGCVIHNGYGQYRHNRKVQYAHRVSYADAKGPIPNGLDLDHLCRNRRCVNPAHLEPVTSRTNALRGVSFVAINARKTECPMGHQYTEGNTMWLKNPRRRQCLACFRERNSANYNARRARILT